MVRFKTRAEARAAIFEYIEVFYNRQRRHSAIGYKTPKQAFNQGNRIWIPPATLRLKNIKT